MWKGTTPTHACPSNRSSSKDAGTRARSDAASTGQCANSRSFHVWVMIQALSGIGQGRCAVSFRISLLKSFIAPSRRKRHAAPARVVKDRSSNGWDGGLMLSFLLRALVVVLLALPLAA